MVNICQRLRSAEGSLCCACYARKLAHEEACTAEGTFKYGLDKRIARVKLLVIW
jgi:hypothetical protein